MLADLFCKPYHIFLSSFFGLSHRIFQVHHILQELCLITFPSLAGLFLVSRSMLFKTLKNIDNLSDK